MKIILKGFTLIELLVVIAVMAIVGTFTVANFRSFGEDKELANAALDIQSLLRTAQTNASANVKCPNGFPSKNWLVNFISSQRIDLDCADSTGGVSSVKSLSLGNNIQLGAVENTSPTVPAPPCDKFKDLTTTSQDCTNFLPWNITGTKYIKCSDITTGNLNCSDPVCGNWSQNIDYYNSPTDATPVNSGVLTATLACNGAWNASVVTLRLWGGSSGGSCISPVKFNFAPLTGAFSSDCNNSSIMQVGVQNAKGSVKLVKVTAGNISIAEGVAVSPSPTASSAPTPTPSPSPSPSPAGGTCDKFKNNGIVVSSQTCKTYSADQGSYYVKCSQIGTTIDCASGGCQNMGPVDFYRNADGTSGAGYGWVSNQFCTGNSVNLTVIP